MDLLGRELTLLHFLAGKYYYLDGFSIFTVGIPKSWSSVPMQISSRWMLLCSSPVRSISRQAISPLLYKRNSEQDLVWKIPCIQTKYSYFD